ncbi:multidrug effflux MFS transporter [Gephyromycinifex aptenodytis]|uniref:multidrug effflux MFS transporter n=1 Tax=Gephyromycinifex aptenodytis TaxID=2716227 RepID=UPI001D00D2C3|nr:multidrug effflux MFS transporter [Gephyromycinifex aptenodytis]
MLGTTAEGGAVQQSRQGAGAGLVLILAGLAMFGPFTIDAVFPAFEAIRRDFSADTLAMQQVTSLYLFCFATMSLLHGPLSDAVGRKPVMLAGISVYALASVGAALAVNLPMLLACRALQGLAAGGGQIVSRAIVRDLFDGPQAQRLMSHIAMIFGMAPALAPIIGGAILSVSPWPGIFWFLVGFAVLMGLSVAFGLPETHPPHRRTPLRPTSLFSELWAVGSQWRFLRIALAGAFGFGGQFLYIASAPLFIVHLLGRGERDFWILFVPMMSGMICGAFLAGRAAGIITAQRLASIGFTIAAAGGVVGVVVTSVPGFADLPWAVLSPTIIAFGIALVFPVVQLALLDEFPLRRGAAASVGTFVSLTFAAVQAGVVSALAATSLERLALTSLGFVILGWVLWAWHVRTSDTPPLAASGA